MNIEYLNVAKEKITSVPLLVNLISKRVRQLNSGQRPYVKPDHPNMSNLDLALKEVAENAITAELPAQDETGDSIENILAL